MSLSDPNSLESQVRAEIRKAKSSWPGGWQPYDTGALQYFLNTKLAPLGVQILVDNRYGPSICAATEKLFGANSATMQVLRSEIGSACQYPNLTSYLQPIPNFKPTMNAANYVSPSEGGLIVDESTPTPVKQAALKPLSSFCNLPGGVCYSDPSLGDTMRRVYAERCRTYGGPGPVMDRVKGIGGVNCDAPPAGGKITPSVVSQFYNMYGPCGLANIPNCPKPCPLPGGACIKEGYLDVLESAQTACQYGSMPAGQSGPCPPSGVIDPNNAHRFSPCELAKLQICGGGAETFDAPPEEDEEEEEEEEENSTKYMIGGLLGLLAIGGIAYAVTRKKKKGRK